MAGTVLRHRIHHGALCQARRGRWRGQPRFVRLRRAGRVRARRRDPGVRRLCGCPPRCPVVEAPARSRPRVPGRRRAGYRHPRVLAWTAAHARRFFPGSQRMRVARPLPAPRSEHPQENSSHSAARGLHGSLAVVISAVATGTSVGRAIDVATYFLTSTYLSATVAYVIARIVYRFNARLTDAREIGSYELIARIGAGGMGEVWRAEHRLLARRVAPAGSKK